MDIIKKIFDKKVKKMSSQIKKEGSKKYYKYKASIGINENSNDSLAPDNDNILTSWRHDFYISISKKLLYQYEDDDSDGKDLLFNVKDSFKALLSTCEQGYSDDNFSSLYNKEIEKSFSDIKSKIKESKLHISLFNHMIKSILSSVELLDSDFDEDQVLVKYACSDFIKNLIISNKDIELNSETEKKIKLILNDALCGLEDLDLTSGFSYDVLTTFLGYFIGKDEAVNFERINGYNLNKIESILFYLYNIECLFIDGLKKENMVLSEDEKLFVEKVKGAISEEACEKNSVLLIGEDALENEILERFIIKNNSFKKALNYFGANLAYKDKTGGKIFFEILNSSIIDFGNYFSEFSNCDFKEYLYAGQFSYSLSLYYIIEGALKENPSIGLLRDKFGHTLISRLNSFLLYSESAGDTERLLSDGDIKWYFDGAVKFYALNAISEMVLSVGVEDVLIQKQDKEQCYSSKRLREIVKDFSYNSPEKRKIKF